MPLDHKPLSDDQRERSLLMERIREMRLAKTTFADIGKSYGFSTSRARQLFLKAEYIEINRKKWWWSAFSVRTLNVFINELGSAFFEMSEPDAAFTVANLHTLQHWKKRIPNCGRGTIEEIRVWLAKHGKHIKETAPE